MKIIAAASVCLVTHLLAGCAGHVHSLIQEETDRDIAMGTFRHEGSEGPSMMLEFEGTRYEAQGFAINRKQNLGELRRRYCSGKHYDRIFSGVDTDHYEYSAEPVLRAEKGTTLRCKMTWTDNISPAGHCVTVDGIHINFRFE